MNIFEILLKKNDYNLQMNIILVNGEERMVFTTYVGIYLLNIALHYEYPSTFKSIRLRRAALA